MPKGSGGANVGFRVEGPYNMGTILGRSFSALLSQANMNSKTALKRAIRVYGLGFIASRVGSRLRDHSLRERCH